MKLKNIIITIVVIILIILPKFLIKPINTGVVKKEVDVVASKSGSQWLEEMKGKFTPIEKILEKNNISFQVNSIETAVGIVSSEVNEPLKGFKFGLYFNVGLKDSKLEDDKSELARINLVLKKGEQFNISKTPLLTDLMNAVYGENSYDYSSLDKELNEAIPNIAVINKYKTFEKKVGEYNEKMQIFKDEKDEIHFEWTTERQYGTISEEEK